MISVVRDLKLTYYLHITYVPTTSSWCSDNDKGGIKGSYVFYGVRIFMTGCLFFSSYAYHYVYTSPYRSYKPCGNGFGIGGVLINYSDLRFHGDVICM